MASARRVLCHLSLFSQIAYVYLMSKAYQFGDLSQVYPIIRGTSAFFVPFVGIFLFAMKLAPLAHIAPIREIGTVFGTLFGIYILKEQQGARRVMMSAVITVGIICIGMWG